MRDMQIPELEFDGDYSREQNPRNSDGWELCQYLSEELSAHPVPY